MKLGSGWLEARGDDRGMQHQTSHFPLALVGWVAVAPPTSDLSRDVSPAAHQPIDIGAPANPPTDAGRRGCERIHHFALAGGQVGRLASLCYYWLPAVLYCLEYYFSPSLKPSSPMSDHRVSRPHPAPQSMTGPRSARHQVRPLSPARARQSRHAVNQNHSIVSIRAWCCPE